VEEHGFSEAHRHYEVKPRAEHQHLLCQRCGKVLEFKNPLIDQMKKQVEEQHSFKVSSADVNLIGICSLCQKDEEARPE